MSSIILLMTRLASEILHVIEIMANEHESLGRMSWWQRVQRSYCAKDRSVMPLFLQTACAAGHLKNRCSRSSVIFVHRTQLSLSMMFLRASFSLVLSLSSVRSHLKTRTLCGMPDHQIGKRASLTRCVWRRIRCQSWCARAPHQ
jgi:hypothetical protein